MEKALLRLLNRPKNRTKNRTNGYQAQQVKNLLGNVIVVPQDTQEVAREELETP